MTNELPFGLKHKNVTGDNEISMLLSFLANINSNVGDWEERTVAIYEQGDLRVDTCWMNDLHCYETAILDPSYSKNWVVVSNYNNWEEAFHDHNLWTKAMIECPPNSLKDIYKGEEYFASFGN